MRPEVARRSRIVRSQMVLQGVRTRNIAEKACVSETWVSLVVCGHRRSERVREVIASALGMSIAELWPNDSDKVA